MEDTITQTGTSISAVCYVHTRLRLLSSRLKKNTYHRYPFDYLADACLKFNQRISELPFEKRLAEVKD